MLSVPKRFLLIGHTQDATCAMVAAALERALSKLTAKLPKRPGRMGNVSRLRVLISFGKLVQRERKAVTQHQSGTYGNARSLT